MGASIIHKLADIVAQGRRVADDAVASVRDRCVGGGCGIRVVESHGSLPSSQAWFDPESTPACLVHADNLVALAELVAGTASQPSLVGKLDLIYCDPPFASQADYSVKVRMASNLGQVTFTRPGYSDSWSAGLEGYLEMLAPRLVLMHQLLAETGSIYIHVDWRVDAYVRVLLDEIFGPHNYRNEIAWCYTSPGRSTKRFKPCHDTIHYYAKGPHPTWTRPQEPLAEATKKVSQLQFAGQSEPWVRDREGKDMVDWWKIIFHTGSHERVGYPTQKPVELLRRIIQASTQPGDLVADFFVGSGTTVVAAAELSRRWIGVDAGSSGIQASRRRLLEAGHDGFCVARAIGAADAFDDLGVAAGVLGDVAPDALGDVASDVTREVSEDVTAAVAPDVTADQECRLGPVFSVSPSTTPDGKDQIVVELIDYLVDPRDIGCVCEHSGTDLAKVLADTPLAAVDSWHLGEYRDGVFYPRWTSLRPRTKTRTTPGQCQVDPVARLSCDNLAVLVVDVFGREHLIRIDPGEPRGIRT